MGAAIITFSTGFYENLRNKKIVGVCLMVSAFVMMICFLLPIRSYYALLVKESAVGLFVSVWLIYLCVKQMRRDKDNLILKILKSGISTRLGTFSYSLYLVHSPILALVNLLLIRYPLSSSIRLMITLFISVPVAIAISYLFYQLVEKRFTKHPVKASDKPIGKLNL